jgi:hypothetical protein
VAEGLHLRQGAELGGARVESQEEAEGPNSGQAVESEKDGLYLGQVAESQEEGQNPGRAWELAENQHEALYFDKYGAFVFLGREHI